MRGRFEEFPLRVLKKQSLHRDLRRHRRLTKVWGGRSRLYRKFNKYKTVRLYTCGGIWYLAYEGETSPDNMTGGWDNKWKAISWFVRDGR